MAITYLRDSSFIEKAVGSKIFWVIFVVFVFGYPLYRSVNRELPTALPTYGKVPEFKMTSQYGKDFGSKDLVGRIYISSFAFTSCPTSCPRIMEKLKVIQKRVKGLGQKIALVTFTVDPETDTPSVLLKHAEKLRSNPFIWKFLTAPEVQMRELLVKGFKVPMGELEEVSKKVDESSITMLDIAHTEKVVLVDKKGIIRGYYSLDKVSTDKLMIDVGLLVNSMFRD